MTLEDLRKEYNAAVSNGLVMKARRILRRIDALESDAAMTENRVPPTDERLPPDVDAIIDAVTKQHIEEHDGQVGVGPIAHAEDGSCDLHVARLVARRMLRQPAPPLDVDGIVAELVGVEAALEDVRRRLVRATDTLGGVARLGSEKSE